MMKSASPWFRVKEDGMRGLVDAESIRSFKRIDAAAKQIGLLINPEGELEGFCRDVSRSNKSEWLAAFTITSTFC